MRGIAAVLDQQFEYGQQILDAGLVPILEPEFAIVPTLTAWDPVSKQPIFKVAAVQVTQARDEDR